MIIVIYNRSQLIVIDSVARMLGLREGQAVNDEQYRLIIIGSMQAAQTKLDILNYEEEMERRRRGE
jgi:hypothetical protein